MRDIEANITALALILQLHAGFANASIPLYDAVKSSTTQQQSLSKSPHTALLQETYSPLARQRRDTAQRGTESIFHIR